MTNPTPLDKERSNLARDDAEAPREAEHAPTKSTSMEEDVARSQDQRAAKREVGMPPKPGESMTNA